MLEPDKKSTNSSFKTVMKKILLLLIVALGIFVYIWYFRPYSDAGVKAGILNNIKHKGIIFKTYEGELIQTGFKSSQAGIHSNDFQFSIDNQELAEKMMKMSGQQVQVHYKEYFGILPWRGYTKYIVDSFTILDKPAELTSPTNVEDILPLVEN